MRVQDYTVRTGLPTCYGSGPVRPLTLEPLPPALSLPCNPVAFCCPVGRLVVGVVGVMTGAFDLGAGVLGWVGCTGLTGFAGCVGWVGCVGFVGCTGCDCWTGCAG
jgi:hypothetical protein